MKIKYRIILVFSLLILSILSYKISSRKIDPDIILPKPALDYNLYKDIVYKNISDNPALKLDIYQPKTLKKEKSPVVIYVHGGAWVIGDKAVIARDFREYVLGELVNNQYTVISINYTHLNTKTHLEKTLGDCKDVLKWIKENADKYNLDINNVGIWGGSSGAHIALLTAYNQDNNTTNFDYPRLRYVVDYYGPSDLNELFKTDANSILLNVFKIHSPDKYKTRRQKIQQLTGFDINNQKAEAVKKCAEFSPITYVTKKTVPTLIFHGTADNVVDISQSQILKNALEKNKVHYQFFVIENAKHLFTNIDLDETKDIAKKTLEFIKSQTKDEK